eukprot:CAMPEP_0114628900 /NCGR_PEP_ID=MMETSP0168-20121206/13071_1 /TAXON_ID=95228 ORGANISM="Vannella sp., Strain DIVA3 517/6/12" /NCGR_SAMPLE_ID=MMETSP0168 /ASSEMBLY_ACC=CAM_ASM_000044 /LENGTH=2064 /DNA_ID=CAMNT_0001840321 /DNA_START=139 /DNA_END=6330 /DNA_ORIENTATION=-
MAAPRFLRAAVLLAILLAAVSCVSADHIKASVESFAPNSAHVAGNALVSIHGCGFRSYSSAVCVWDWRYYSPVHIIRSDDLIYCETPEIPLEDFETLPHFASLSVIFDGDERFAIDISDDFRFGPSTQEFTPFDGYVLGGEKFHVIGDGFSDFSSASIFFDGVEGIDPLILSDNEIVCVVPPGEFNQNAIINVMFDNNPKYYLHFDQTYHYGPILYGVNPSCGSFEGGTEVTILGINLDDPTLGINAPPAGQGPTVEVLYNNGQDRFAVDSTLDQEKNLITFDSPVLPIAYGDTVQFAVFFKGVNSKVKITPLNCFHYDCLDNPFGATGFTYGPVVRSVSPSSGHLLGGDSITITGCGLNDFSVVDTEVFAGGTPLCDRGFFAGNNTDTLHFVDNAGRDNEQIVCQTVAFPCGTTDNEFDVTVEFSVNGTVEVNQSAGSYQVGPSFDLSSLNPTRGPRTGRDTVQINGDNFFADGFATASNPGWIVVARFASVDDPSLTLPGVQATLVSDTQLTFDTPIGLFDLDVEITFDFGSCLSFPRDTSGPTYHYGPVCTGVTPVNGHFSGNSPLTIIGEGFTEDNNLIVDTDVRLCIDRLSPSNATCAYEPHVRDSTFTLEDEQITIITPDYRQNIVTEVGANRLFGDTASVWVHFTQPGADNIEFPRNQLRPGLNVARIQCPASYRFGPKVDSITPNKGPGSPRGASSPGTEFTVNGTFLDDPVLDNSLTEVDLGGIEAFNVATASDEEITGQTVWGNVANTEVDLRVIVDTCNQTFSGTSLKWGPQITSIFASKNGPVTASENNPNADVYGIVPTGGDSIVIQGEGFTDFSDEGSDAAIAVYIDGSAVPFTVVSDTQITTTAPCRAFGTVATVAVAFGTICDTEDIDWNQTLTASQLLRYTPRIDSISPTSGHTSGGTPVTITGEGFTGWSAYECFFGHYSDQQHIIPLLNGQQITCNTPINRGEFNTDVTVHIQLNADDDDDSATSRSVRNTQFDDDECDQDDDDDDGLGSEYHAVEDYDMKVVAPQTYHYGPVCTAVSTTICPIGGCPTTQAVSGTGFQDCLFVSSDPQDRDGTYPWQDCVFQFYNINLIDSEGNVVPAPLQSNSTTFSGNTDTRLQFSTPGSVLGANDESVEIQFFFPPTSTDPEESLQTTIRCETGIHYGPVFTSQESEYWDASTSTSYGWGGDSITINGVGFNDPALYQSLANIHCAIDGVEGTVTSVSSNGQTAVCVVPDQDFDVTGQVTLFWTGGEFETSIDAAHFHYGPVIRSMSPTRGFVAGGEQVTITGFAFECCGITDYQCAFPEGADVTDDTELIPFANQVTCQVPKNDFIDRQINNVGVRFQSPLFNTPDFTYSSTFTEQETALRYYYGPSVYTAYIQDLPTLSGRDQVLIIEGEGFNDPFLIEAYCDFFDASGNGVNYIPFEPLERSNQTATSLTCPILEFSHNCGAVDVVRPRWRRNVEEYQPEQNQNYWKTEAPAQEEVDAEPFFSNAGSEQATFYGPIVYGPNIVSVCSGNDCDENLPVSPIEGGMTVTVTFDSLRDFVSSSPNKDFGSEEALCVFGSRRALSTSPIVADPDVDGLSSVTCVTPPGAIAMSGEVSVILAPNINEDTVVEEAFHVVPSASGFSRDWGYPEGHESVVIYGEGFCQYERVYCLFDNFEGVQGDITSDREVTCVTPLHAPGSVSVSLRFCATDDCDCTFFDTEDLVPVGDFTFIGVSGIFPHQGPVCGGTNVTFSGFGFDNFQGMFCSVAGVTTAALFDDTGISCTTPDISSRFIGENPEFVECLTTTIIASHFGQSTPLFNPFKFEFGVMELFSALPDVMDIDDPQVVTIRGDYLNGESFNENDGLECVFGDEEPVPATVVLGADGVHFLQCQFPQVETVGRYDVHVNWDCAEQGEDRFSTNSIPITVTQTPQFIDNPVRPRTSPEIGGVTVTIQGDNFNGSDLVLCSFGEVNTGSEKVVGSLGFDEEGNILCKTPAFQLTSDLSVPLWVSLDRAETWTKVTNDFEIYDIVAADDDDAEQLFPLRSAAPAPAAQSLPLHITSGGVAEREALLAPGVALPLSPS